MKTAISLPDATFRRADLAARRLGLSRSELYVRALEAYLGPPSDDEITGDADRPGQHASGVFNQPPFVEDVPPSPRRATGAKGVDRVSVRAVARRVRIVGDGTVATASPLRRNVTIEDVGNAAAFLMSDLASGVTAEIMYVDGGFSQTGGISRDSIA